MRRGFTLIELLVVIAIIAVLAAILFPVYARAKAAGDAGSISNAKQLGAALLLYLGDNDDVMPQVAEGPAGTGVSGTVVLFCDGHAKIRQAQDRFMQTLCGSETQCWK